MEAKMKADGAPQFDQRLFGLLEVVSDWYWEQDANLCFTLVTGPALEKVGIDPKADLGKKRWEQGGVLLEDSESWIKHKALLEARKPFTDFVYKYIDTNGEQHYVSASGQPVFDPQGAFSGYRGIGKDVTSQIHLIQREERYRNLIELSADWAWEQDDQYRTIYIDGRMEEKCGVSPDSRLGKRHWDFPSPNLSEEDWAHHQAQLARREPFRDLELRMPDTRDGQRWVSVSGQPVFDIDGNFRGYRGIGRDITARKNNEERIRYLATHDALTSLPNRSLFSEFLQRTIQSARRYDRSFAVVFIDLDRFKMINDTLGHDAGDTLLKIISIRLTECLRTSDVVARLGGDEFVVLLQEVEESIDASSAANKILSSVIKPVMLLDQECRITASVGICMFTGVEDEQTLMKNADIAMYRAKEDGKNNYRFYSDDIKSQSLERMILETSLRRAVEFNQFFLHYQAQVDIHTGAITGVEALVRWQHPELGVVQPLQFISLAEETGLIVPIGRWVLNEACAQNARWQKEGLPPVCMAVNLSARQFVDDSLLSDIANAPEESGMEPHLLELELTESMVIHNFELAAELLLAIKKMGVRLAIDDFGTGYSSLAQLKHFPIDTLKVDRSFIRDLATNVEDRAITKAIIDMGKSLNLNVVAEGVETKDQENFLRENHCDEMQGFYFSKPISPDQFSTLCRFHSDKVNMHEGLE